MSSSNLFSASELVFTQLSPIDTTLKSFELNIKNFHFWLNFWEHVYKDLNETNKIEPIEFFKHDLINTLWQKETVVAQHFIKLFSKVDFLNDQYAESLGPKSINYLENLNLEQIITLQYVSVNPNFNVFKTGINLSVVIAKLSLNTVRTKNSIFITIARKDVPSFSGALKLGFKPIEEKFLHNAPVAVMVCDLPCDYKRETEKTLTDKLWESRIANHHKIRKVS